MHIFLHNEASAITLRLLLSTLIIRKGVEMLKTTRVIHD